MVLTSNINLLTILVAGVINFFIGMFWYSPAGFGLQWMKLKGITPKKIKGAKKGGMGKAMFTAFIVGLIMIFILAHVIAVFNVNTLWEGVQVSFWMWLGFVATVMYSGVIWDKMPMQLFWINSLHYLAILVVGGGILSIWG